MTEVGDAESQQTGVLTVNAVDARMVRVTEYVFAGDAATEYAENAPLAWPSAYCRTKAAGEWAGRPELFSLAAYHGTSSGETRWYGVTQEVFRLIRLHPDRVLPTTSDACVWSAPKREWREALAVAMTDVVGVPA